MMMKKLMKNRLLALFTVLCMVLPLATGSASAFDVLERYQYTTSSDDGIILHRLDPISLNGIPQSDDFITLKTADLNADSRNTVIIDGSWTPNYNTMWILLEKTDGFGSYCKSQPMKSGSKITFTIELSGTYRVAISSMYGSINTGVLNIDW